MQQKVFRQFFSRQKIICCFGWTLVWAEGADLSSSRCCQIQEVLHSSCWNLQFHLLQLPMWCGGHRKILLAPFQWPEHLKPTNPSEIVEPDASLTFPQEDQEPNQQLHPRVWPSGGTFRRDFRVDSESESTQEVAVVRWTSPLSPRGAAKQVSNRGPPGCVRHMLCSVSSCLLWLFTQSSTSDFFKSFIYLFTFLTICTSPVIKNGLKFIGIKSRPRLVVCEMQTTNENNIVDVKFLSCTWIYRPTNKWS